MSQTLISAPHRRSSREPISPGRRTAVLATMLLALVLVVAGVSMMAVAVPTLTAALGASPTDTQWIVDGYTVALAALLLPAGAFGDRFGRRRALVAGIAIFGVASAASALSDSAERAHRVARAHRRRRRADHARHPVDDHERVPARRARQGRRRVGRLRGRGRHPRDARRRRVARAVVVGLDLRRERGARRCRAGRDAARRCPRRAKASTSASIRSARCSRCSRSAAWCSASSKARAAVGATRSRSSASSAASSPASCSSVGSCARRLPLLDPRLFQIRGFATGSTSLFLQFFAIFGFFFISLQYLQLVLGYGTLKSAVALLPIAVVMMPLSTVAATLAERYGQRIIGAAGLAISAVGFVDHRDDDRRARATGSCSSRC